MTTTNEPRSKKYLRKWVLSITLISMLIGLIFVVVVVFLNYSKASVVVDCQSLSATTSSYYSEQTNSILTRYARQTVTKDAIVIYADVKKAYSTNSLPNQTTNSDFLTFSPDNKIVASSDSDGNIKLYDATTGNLQTVISSGLTRISGLSFRQKNNSLILSGTDQQGKSYIKFWETLANHQLNSVNVAGLVTDFAFNSANDTLITLIQNNNQEEALETWNATSGQQLDTLAQHLSGAISLALSADGNFLAVGFRQGLIRVWNLTNHEEIESLNCLAGEVTALSFSKTDSNKLIGVVASSINSWNLTNRFESKQYNSSDNKNIAAVAVAGTDSKNYFVVATGNTSGQVLLWDGVWGSIIFSDADKKSGVSSLTFSSDTKLLAANYKDGSLVVWKIENLHTELGNHNS